MALVQFVDANGRRAEQMLRVDSGHGARQPGLDGCDAGQVRQIAGVVCRRGRSKDGSEQAKVFRVDC